ncbi:hypothetical protein TWF970_001160 [Orbilia oligospora]|uniref:non-specific serine/threonine protein kinase n=1 Tax=Orbilia oligospora TaxID=2813651 RepID=A0A7C8VBZ8_ORBOL|nr:hypothetical protein TWF970_001160 [Orbilia oligospora]
MSRRAGGSKLRLPTLEEEYAESSSSRRAAHADSYYANDRRSEYRRSREPQQPQYYGGDNLQLKSPSPPRPISTTPKGSEKKPRVEGSSSRKSLGFFGALKERRKEKEKEKERIKLLKQEEKLYGPSQPHVAEPHRTPSQQTAGHSQRYHETEQRVHRTRRESQEVSQGYENEVLAQMQDLELEEEPSSQYDQYPTDKRNSLPELQARQRRVITQLPYDRPDPRRRTDTINFNDADFPDHGDAGFPKPYELPSVSGFNEDLRIVKRHNAGCFGATAILEVRNDSSSSVTRSWYEHVPARTRVIAKRITACDRTRARSWKTESDALKVLASVQPTSEHILKIFGRLAPSRGDPFGHIFTEYCSMGDVSEILGKYVTRRTFMPEGFLWQMTIDVSRALLFLNRGITKRNMQGRPGWTPMVHNDIKMNNIFVKPRPDGWNNIYPLFVLGDFGLSSFEGQAAYPSCPPFMSLQRVNSFYKPTPAVHKDDIYSLGTTLFVLSNGYFPFEVSDAPERELNYDKRIDHRNPYRNGFCKLMNRCTSRNPDTRPTAREMIGEMIGLIEAKGWSKEGSRDRFWKVEWMPKSKAARWKDKDNNVEI